MIVRRLRGIRRIVIRRAPILPWKLHSANRYNIFLVHPVEKKKKKGSRNYTPPDLLPFEIWEKREKRYSRREKKGRRGERGREMI